MQVEISKEASILTRRYHLFRVRNLPAKQAVDFVSMSMSGVYLVPEKIPCDCCHAFDSLNVVLLLQELRSSCAPPKTTSVVPRW